MMVWLLLGLVLLGLILIVVGTRLKQVWIIGLGTMLMVGSCIFLNHLLRGPY